MRIDVAGKETGSGSSPAGMGRMNRVTEEYRQWWTQMSQALRAREWVGLLVVGVIGGVVYIAIPLFAVLVLLGVIR